MTRWRHVLACASALAVAVTGCGGARSDIGVDDLPDVIERSNETPRVVTETVGAVTARVEVEDDYRYAAATEVDGRLVASEIVHDDRRYVRFDDPAFVAGLAQLAPGAAALPTGTWLHDRRGPLPEFGQTDDTPSVFPPSLALDRVRVLETLVEELRKGRQRAWNPDSTQYLEKDDRFPRHEEDGTRFDSIPSAFDRDGFFRDGVPVDLEDALERHFQYTSVWVRDGRIRRVEMLFDPPDLTAVIARAMRLQAERTGTVFDERAVPRTPPRRARTILFDYPERAPVVQPPEDALPVELPPRSPAPAPPAPATSAPGTTPGGRPGG